MMERSCSIDNRFINVEENYKRITERLELAAQQVSMPPAELVAVTKTVPVELMNHAISLGVRHIGENRVQELAGKYDQLLKDDLKISVIGHLQTNKVKSALGMAHMIQSLDSDRLAREISARCEAMGRQVECLVEINAGDEESKTGITFEKAEELALYAASLPCIKVVGLMTIPPIVDDVKKTRDIFAKIHNLFIDIGSKNHDNSNIEMKYLSMGMSADYYEAALEGANMVRVGSALFGARSYK